MAVTSIVIAIPIAHWIVTDWLQEFSCRIDPGWSVYAIAIVAGFGCALIAVSYHTIRAALANPIRSLRTE